MAKKIKGSSYKQSATDECWMCGLTLWLGCIGTKAVLGYRVTVTPLSGRGERETALRNSPETAQTFLRAAVVSLPREENDYF